MASGMLLQARGPATAKARSHRPIVQYQHKRSVIITELSHLVNGVSWRLSGDLRVWCIRASTHCWIAPRSSTTDSPCTRRVIRSLAGQHHAQTDHLVDSAWHPTLVVRPGRRPVVPEEHRPRERRRVTATPEWAVPGHFGAGPPLPRRRLITRDRTNRADVAPHQNSDPTGSLNDVYHESTSKPIERTQGFSGT